MRRESQNCVTVAFIFDNKNHFMARNTYILKNLLIFSVKLIFVYYNEENLRKTVNILCVKCE